MSTTTTEEGLKVASTEEVKKALNIVDPKEVTLVANEESDIDKQADTFVDALINFDANNHELGEQHKASVENMGSGAQKESAQHLSMLRQPIKDMSRSGEDGGDIANTLIDLKVNVENLDPAKFDFQPGWITRSFGFLPFVGTPLKKYFSKYESTQTVIAAIMHSLKSGKAKLERDNITLKEDQKGMRKMTHRLEKTIRLAQIIDQKLSYKLEREIQPDNPKHNFIKEELLFPLRQRMMDLQQQLAVNQQGVMATELIIRNNKELIRGVDRSVNVTISALEVGATVALALANQKIVLDKIEAVNKTTSDLIKGTAERLKTQGVAIQKQAAGAQLDIEALKSAFADINIALNDISTFRQEALPQMATTILQLDQLTDETEKAIKKMEEGSNASPDLLIEVKE